MCNCFYPFLHSHKFVWLMKNSFKTTTSVFRFHYYHLIKIVEWWRTLLVFWPRCGKYLSVGFAKRMCVRPSLCLSHLWVTPKRFKTSWSASSHAGTRERCLYSFLRPNFAVLNLRLTSNECVQERQSPPPRWKPKYDQYCTISWKRHEIGLCKYRYRIGYYYLLVGTPYGLSIGTENGDLEWPWTA